MYYLGCSEGHVFPLCQPGVCLVRFLVGFLLLVSRFTEVNSQKILSIGSEYQENLVQDSYLRYSTSLNLAEDSLVYLTAEPTSGDVDLYVSDETLEPTRDNWNYHWKSNTLGSRKEEALVLLFPPGPVVLYTAAYCFRGQATSQRDEDGRVVFSCSFTMDLRVQPFDLVPLPDQLEPKTQSVLQVGEYLFYQFEVSTPGIQQLNLEFDIAPAVKSASRNSVTMIASLRRESLFTQQRNGEDVLEGRVGRLKTYTSVRGISSFMQMYIEGPATVYISANAGFRPPQSFEDETIEFTSRGYTKNVTLQCLRSDRQVSDEFKVGYDEVHFWAVAVANEEPIARIELEARGGQVKMLVHDRHWPLPMDAADFEHKYTCGTCSHDQMLDNIHNSHPPDLMDAAKVCNVRARHRDNSTRFLFMTVRGSVISRDSRYVIRSLGLDAECGWRPSCQSCSLGGKGCTWCGRHGGYCDSTTHALQQYDLCEQAAWCDDPSPCARASSCETCTAIANCGWCGNAEKQGVCTQGSDQGPSSGLCQEWLYGQEADCGRQCRVHDSTHTTADSCLACTQDPACGFCHSPLVGTCLVGDMDGAFSHDCPSEGTNWVPKEDQCFRVTGEVPQDFEPTVVKNGTANLTLTLSDASGCFLNTCSFAVLAVPVGDARNIGSNSLNMHARLEVLPGSASVVGMMMRAQIPSEDNFHAKAVAMPDWREYEGGAREYVLAGGICLESEPTSDVYFTIMLLPNSRQRDAAVHLSVVMASAEMNVKIQSGFKARLSNQSTCCSAMQFHTLVPSSEYSASISVTVESTSNMYIYARAGACPSTLVHDHATTTLVPTLKLPNLQDGVLWHLGILGDTDNPADYVLHLEVTDVNYLQELSGSDMSIEVEYIAVGAVGAVLFLACCAALIWGYKGAVDPRTIFTAALLENADALTRSLEQPGHYQPLAYHNDAALGSQSQQLLEAPDRSHMQIQAHRGGQMGVELALMEVEVTPSAQSGLQKIQGSSAEEEELVGLIESMSKQIKRLENEASMLRGSSSTARQSPSKKSKKQKRLPGPAPALPALTYKGMGMDLKASGLPVGFQDFSGLGREEDEEEGMNAVRPKDLPGDSDSEMEPLDRPPAARRIVSFTSYVDPPPSGRAVTPAPAVAPAAKLKGFPLPPHPAASSSQPPHASAKPTKSSKAVPKLPKPGSSQPSAPPPTSRRTLQGMKANMDMDMDSLPLDFQDFSVLARRPPDLPADASDSDWEADTEDVHTAGLGSKGPGGPGPSYLAPSREDLGTGKERMMLLNMFDSEDLDSMMHPSNFDQDAAARRDMANVDMSGETMEFAMKRNTEVLEVGSVMGAESIVDHEARPAFDREAAMLLELSEEEDEDVIPLGPVPESPARNQHAPPRSLPLPTAPILSSSTPPPPPPPASSTEFSSSQISANQPSSTRPPPPPPPPASSTEYSSSQISAAQPAAAQASKTQPSQPQVLPLTSPATQLPPGVSAQVAKSLAEKLVKATLVEAPPSTSNQGSKGKAPAVEKDLVGEESAQPGTDFRLLGDLPAVSPSAPSVSVPSFRVDLLCPDGSSRLCSAGIQTIGRGLGGVVLKNVSREHASLSIDLDTGAVVLKVLGKNRMHWRPTDSEEWRPIGKGQEVSLSSQSEFCLLAKLEGAIENATFMVLVKSLKGVGVNV